MISNFAIVYPLVSKSMAPQRIFHGKNVEFWLKTPKKAFFLPYSDRKFFTKKTYSEWTKRVTQIKVKEFSDLTASIKQVTKDHMEMHADATHSMKAAANNAGSVNKLYKSGNKSFLIKAGLALIVFPEPIVSDLLGTSLLAAGAIQQGIKHQSIYLDDLPKAFKSAMRDLKKSKDLF